MSVVPVPSPPISAPVVVPEASMGESVRVLGSGLPVYAFQSLDAVPDDLPPCLIVISPAAP
jgi:hypothetical protein